MFAHMCLLSPFGRGGSPFHDAKLNLSSSGGTLARLKTFRSFALCGNQCSDSDARINLPNKKRTISAKVFECIIIFISRKSFYMEPLFASFLNHTKLELSEPLVGVS